MSEDNKTFPQTQEFLEAKTSSDKKEFESSLTEFGEANLLEIKEFGFKMINAEVPFLLIAYPSGFETNNYVYLSCFNSKDKFNDKNIFFANGITCFAGACTQISKFLNIKIDVSLSDGTKIATFQR